MSTNVPLKKPIQAHGATVTSITLERPKGKEIAACGLPRHFLRRGKTIVMEVDAEAIHAYISALGNIPPSSVDQIDAEDWMEVQEAVLDFFVSTPKAGAADDAPPAPPAPAVSQTAPGTIAMPFQDSTT